ncbi:MAG: UDP-N-acetylmuramoyl-L-alanine--D-glutamate ligase [Ignavibacteriales bacterium]|nr:UDP-N-acetylmuramoyl-L-alanine--D-glutamate ligase [Ignavibacteriales bacterium]
MENVIDKNIEHRKISVLGAARSGVAVARLLASKGANVFVSDCESEEKLRASVQELKSLGVKYEIGGHTERILEADLIVISPGVPSNISIVDKANQKEIPVISELEISSWFCKAPIIAVTGTNGKTTTTILIGKILDDAGIKNIVGGNIGTAFSGFVQSLDEKSVAVLEVSSFQLDHIITFRPKISIILNITPDHLDRYDHNFEKYIASKCRIFENQTNDDYLIYNYDDEETQEQVRRLASLHIVTLPFGIEPRFDEGAHIENGKLTTVLRGLRTEIIDVEQIGIRGIHNLYNSMAATLAAHLTGARVSSIFSTLENFKGVEHRLEFVRELNGVVYINDSKATNVSSVWYALQVYNQPLILMLGGRDKGNDYSKLTELIEKHVKTIIAIGESADKVCQEFSGIKPVVKADTMEDAVNKAGKFAINGDIVLLSPACASFDWFQNYEHRGRVFKQIVNSL